MAILEHIEEEKQKLSKLDGVELEREYKNLMQSIKDRLEQLKNEKKLLKVIYRNNNIVGVINLNEIEW